MAISKFILAFCLQRFSDIDPRRYRHNIYRRYNHPVTDIYNEQLNRLKQILETAANCGLNIKWKKCHNLQQQVEYLGLIITEGKIAPTGNKLTAASKFPISKTMQSTYIELRRLNRTISGIYSRLRKNIHYQICWKPAIIFSLAKSSGLRLKQCLSSRPVLHLFNGILNTDLHTDASVKGYGAILLQQKPIKNCTQRITSVSENIQVFIVV